MLHSCVPQFSLFIKKKHKNPCCEMWQRCKKNCPLKWKVSEKIVFSTGGLLNSSASFAALTNFSQKSEFSLAHLSLEENNRLVSLIKRIVFLVSNIDVKPLLVRALPVIPIINFFEPRGNNPEDRLPTKIIARFRFTRNYNYATFSSSSSVVWNF